MRIQMGIARPPHQILFIAEVNIAIFLNFTNDTLDNFHPVSSRISELKFFHHLN